MSQHSHFLKFVINTNLPKLHGKQEYAIGNLVPGLVPEFSSCGSLVPENYLVKKGPKV